MEEQRSVGGPVTAQLADRQPFGAMERLAPDRLREEHRRTIASPRRRYSASARALFAAIDAVYGRERSLEKFRVLELVARVPYQAWENVAYVAVTHTAAEPGFARRVFDTVRLARWEQDNEQWHLLMLEDMIGGRTRRSFLRDMIVPQVLAFAYYQLSWLMYAIRPSASYRLNADFEDHAEHEYALYVEDHPELEDQPYEGAFQRDFGTFDSVADLFRQISYDERLHKLESETRIHQPRFG